MRWGFVRLAIIGSAFLIGMMVAGYQNSEVLAPGPSVADLPAATGTSLVVACDSGDPTVEHVTGVNGAVEVKCQKSQMRVTRFGFPTTNPDVAPTHINPSTPMVSTGKSPMHPLMTGRVSS
jgi:hypothetical protein